MNLHVLSNAGFRDSPAFFSFQCNTGLCDLGSTTFLKDSLLLKLMEPLMHWIIPTAVILAVFPKLNRKTVLLLSPLVFVPDLDYFIPGMHRVLTSNLFFAAILVFIIYKLFGKSESYIGGYFLLSHLLLDLGFPGTALFWPLVDKLYYVTFNIHKNAGWVFDIGAGSMPIEGAFKLTHNYIFTHGFLAFLLVILTLGVYYYTKKKK